jgi:hypothetical protein
MTIESIRRISITAMVLLLVLAAAAAQTTSTPLYVDGVLRVVATFHHINEGSLPVSGSMESFGTSVYPSWPRDAQRTRTILQSIDAEVQRMERAKCLLKRCYPGKAHSTGQARQAKDERGRACTDCSSTTAAVGESKEGGEVARKTDRFDRSLIEA